MRWAEPSKESRWGRKRQDMHPHKKHKKNKVWRGSALRPTSAHPQPPKVEKGAKLGGQEPSLEVRLSLKWHFAGNDCHGPWEWALRTKLIECSSSSNFSKKGGFREVRTNLVHIPRPRICSNNWDSDLNVTSKRSARSSEIAGLPKTCLEWDLCWEWPFLSENGCCHCCEVHVLRNGYNYSGSAEFVSSRAKLRAPPKGLHTQRCTFVWVTRSQMSCDVSKDQTKIGGLGQVAHFEKTAWRSPLKRQTAAGHLSPGISERSGGSRAQNFLRQAFLATMACCKNMMLETRPGRGKCLDPDCRNYCRNRQLEHRANLLSVGVPKSGHDHKSPEVRPHIYIYIYFFFVYIYIYMTVCVHRETETDRKRDA